MADTFRQLGSKRVWVVNGDGLDEITVTGPTRITTMLEDVLDTTTLDPRDHGIARSPLAAIQGGTPVDNAAALIRLLEGEAGAYRDIVCLNAAAALLIAEKAQDFTHGLALARESLDSGRALTLLRDLQQDKTP
jgi:anthranilate phosphoribosyltransferase